jgi:hypothetical protein
MHAAAAAALDDDEQPGPVDAAAAEDAEVAELAAELEEELAEHGREEADAWGDVPFEELLGLQVGKCIMITIL